MDDADVMRLAGSQEQFGLPSVRQSWMNAENFQVKHYGGHGPVYIFFSSHALYYPNEERVAHAALIDRDRFEWYVNHPRDASKVIFVRDVWKQWYLTGINSKVNHPDLLTDLLRKECGLSHDIICVGVSAGGYAAIWHGTRLRARAVYAFAAQADLSFEVRDTGQSEKNPLVMDHLVRASAQTHLRDVLGIGHRRIYYFYGSRSTSDLPHAEVFKQYLNVVTVPFRSDLHGVPFGGIALTALLSDGMGSRFICRLATVLAPMPPALLRVFTIALCLPGLLIRQWRRRWNL